MSHKNTYDCTVLIDASAGATVEADSPEEAAELAEQIVAERGAGSLCHQCANHTEVGDFYAVVVYQGDKQVLDTDYRAIQLEKAGQKLAELIALLREAVELDDFISPDLLNRAKAAINPAESGAA